MASEATLDNDYARSSSLLSEELQLILAADSESFKATQEASMMALLSSLLTLLPSCCHASTTMPIQKDQGSGMVE